MNKQRWLRIVPVALIMYTISYVDRTNISLSLDPKISTMMSDLGMNNEMKGDAAGVFFFGYMLLQIPGGWLASRWSARKVVSIFLVAWGLCAAGIGFVHTFRQFEVMRFFLGMAESGVFPATLVLMANWFPRAERARANNGWLLCQPLAVAGSAPLTGWLLGAYGWRTMTIFEGILPFIWLPIWWFCVTDHPREAKWISAEERNYLEKTLSEEARKNDAAKHRSNWGAIFQPILIVMIVFYFLHNAAAYGCMTFFTDRLKTRSFSQLQYGLLLAVPYVVTAVVMVLNAWHSDKRQERRAHVAMMYLLSGYSLLASVAFSNHFWLSFGFLCLAIPGPFAAMAPFWSCVGETMPVAVLGTIMGGVNAFGNLGGFAGPKITGWAYDKFGSTDLGFTMLGAGMMVCVLLAFLLPKTKNLPSVTKESTT